MAEPDVPPKTAARIVELLDLATDLFPSFEAADIPTVVLWLAQEVVGSRKFPAGLEVTSIIRLADELFAPLIAEADAPAADPDHEPTPTEDEANASPRDTIESLAREFRYQLRYGNRTAIGKEPRRCSIC